MLSCQQHTLINFILDGSDVGAIAQFAAVDNGKSPFIGAERVRKLIRGIEFISDSHLLKYTLFQNIIPFLNFLHDIVIGNFKFKRVHFEIIERRRRIFRRGFFGLSQSLQRGERKS